MASATDTTENPGAEAVVDAPRADAAEAVTAPKTGEPTAAKAVSKIDQAVTEAKTAPTKTAPTKSPPAKVRTTKPSARKAAKPAKGSTISAPKAAPVGKTATKAAPRKATGTIAGAKTIATRIPRVAQLKDKIMATTAPNTEFTDTVKNAAADVQSKAKAAYEKMQAYAGDMTEFTKGNVEALVTSGKILGQGVQDMARSEVETAKGAFETATADLKAMAAIKSPTELFKLQGEIMRRNFDAAVAHYSKNAETSMKLANDAFAPISNRMSIAAEKISKAA